MSFIRSFFSIFMDALFPISKAEREILSMTTEQAFKILPRSTKSPIYDSCSIFSYKDERVWRLIWSIKYKKSIKGSKIAGFAIYKVISIFSKAVKDIVIIPMPITAKRRRERGFNQCELITHEIEILDINRLCKINYNLLKRTRHKSRQTLKDREDRLESAKNIFSVNHDSILKLETSEIEKLKQSLIIVIDDVVTTGSTINDAISTLREAGFEKTFGLSLAH